MYTDKVQNAVQLSKTVHKVGKALLRLKVCYGLICTHTHTYRSLQSGIYALGVISPTSAHAWQTEGLWGVRRWHSAARRGAERTVTSLVRCARTHLADLNFR
jgi:hypothetical protein